MLNISHINLLTVSIIHWLCRVGPRGRGGLGPPPILGIMCIKYAEFILDTPFGPPPPNPVYVPTLLSGLALCGVVSANHMCTFILVYTTITS